MTLLLFLGRAVDSWFGVTVGIGTLDGETFSKRRKKGSCVKLQVCLFVFFTMLNGCIVVVLC